MTILCAGINHHSAPIEVREKFAIGGNDLQESLSQLRAIDGLFGAVIVSTCNRVEFYAASVCPMRVMDGMRRFIEKRAGVAAAPFYTHDSHLSIRHLFRVAKQVRSETQITRGSTSVGSVAVDLAGKIFGDLSGRKVMLLGAGDTSERVARSLVSRGVRTVIVANRTFDRAAALADEIGGLAVHFDHWHTAFDEVDILICSTAAPHPIVTREKLEAIMQSHHERPLFIIDLAVPRDVHPSVNDLENVYLYDIDSLEQIARQSIEVRQGEITRCEKMIDRHVRDFLLWMRNHPGATR